MFHYFAAMDMKIPEDRPRVRMTRQRTVILRELSNTEAHPTACEVYDMVRRELPRVSLGTVYRNLELLARDGKIRKLNLDGEQKRFDGRISHHYHLKCLECGRIFDIDLPDQMEIVRKANRRNKCLVTGYRLEFTGLCPGCRKEKRRS